MICRPEEAYDRVCCVMQKACMGPGCMAWIKEVRRSAEPEWRFVETGRGYCGHIYQSQAEVEICSYSTKENGNE